MPLNVDRPSFSPWKVIGRREVLSIPDRVTVSIESVLLPDGRYVDDYVQIDIPHFVLVFAVTSSDKVIWLRQYRHGARCVGLELPSGHINPAERPLEAARRELLEETGYESEDWTSLGSFVKSTSHRIGTGHVFRAGNAVRVQEPCSGDLEETSIELLTRDELVAAIRRSEVVSGSCLAACALALL
jgi:ADP-ribose pyrophosphatase